MGRRLVTGGAGFIGFHLASRLAARGDEVTIVDNLFRGAADDAFAALIARPNVRFIEADLCDPASLAPAGHGYDTVYHLAAINGTALFYTMPDRILRDNLLSTIHLLDWFSDGERGRFVFSSSSETYASGVGLVPIPIPTPEAVPLVVRDTANPRWSYGGSKIAGELLVANYARMRDLDTVIIRFANAYGPRMGYGHVIPELTMRLIREEDPLEVFGGEDTRSFSYIDDVVRGVLIAGEDPRARGLTLNVGDDREEIRIIDLVGLLCGIAGRHPRIVDRGAPEGSVRRRCPDISRLRALGFEPSTALAEGLRETWTWYQRAAAPALSATSTPSSAR